MHAPTIADIVNIVNRLDPIRAASYRNGDRAHLCATDEFRRVRLSDEIIPLERKDGKYLAVYVRVSTLRQKGRLVGQDGYSVEDQIQRGVQIAARRGIAFKVYSDAGLGGGLPYDDPGLIQDLAHMKAEFYRDAINSVFLSEYSPYTPEQRRAVECARDAHVEDELRLASDKDFDLEGGSTQYRPGLTTLLDHLPLVDTVVTADLSRLARSQYLFAEICKHFDRKKVNVVGSIESLDWITKKGLGERTMGFILAVSAEQRLREVRANAIRGIVAMLQSGKPHGTLPFWLTRAEEGDPDGYPEGAAKVHSPELLDLALDIIAYYLDKGMSPQSIAERLVEQGVRAVRGEEKWHRGVIRGILHNKNLVGLQPLFGLDWPVLPALINQDRFDAVQRRLEERKVAHPAPGVGQTYLLSGVLRCLCGNALVHCMIGPSKYRAYACHPGRQGYAAPEVHYLQFKAGDLETFFNDLFAHYGQMLLSAHRSGKHRDALSQEIAALREEQAWVEGERKEKKEQFQRQARLLAEKEDIAEDDEFLAAYVRGKLRPYAEKMERIERDMAEKNLRLAQIFASDSLTDIEDCMRLWEEQDVERKNWVIRTLLREVRYTEEGDRGWFTPYLNTAEENHVPSIPVRVTRYIDGKARRRLAVDNVHEWVVQYFTPKKPSPTLPTVLEDRAGKGT